MTNATGDGPRTPGRAAPRPPVRRLYKSVTVAAETPSPHVGEGRGRVEDAPPARWGGESGRWFCVLLDGKALRTPAKAPLAVPTRALAEAIAAEWEVQREHIDPATMPLTRLVNSAIDGVRGREADVRADIVRCAASDLLCYRTAEPEGLASRHAELWDPVLAWSRDTLGAGFEVVEGLMPLAQPEAAKSAVARALADCDAFSLAALHVMTTLMGSALLALAHARGQLAVEAAWTAAHVDEDWQIAKWGEDAEAAIRRRGRWAEMQVASRMLTLVR